MSFRESRPDGAANGPVYQRIKKHVLDRIRAGDWSTGDRIPSEHEFKDQFGVSRMTVHRALRELVDEGYVSRVVGAGTYVTDRRAAGATLPLHDLCEEARRTGCTCQIRVVSTSRGAPAPEIARRLQLSPDDCAFRTVLVWWIDNWPVQLEERWVNLAYLPAYGGQDFSAEPPASVLARLVPALSFDREVQAVIPKGTTRTMLALSSGEPCLLLSEMASFGNQPLSVADLYHPGSRYALPGRFL